MPFLHTNTLGTISAQPCARYRRITTPPHPLPQLVPACISLSEAGPSRLQLRGQGWVFLLDLDLRPRGLCVGQRIHQLAFRARKVRRPLKVLERFCHLALLQEELGHRGDSNIALGVDCVVLAGIRERVKTTSTY